MLPHTVFAHARSPTERLRIGYVTGDLHRQHPVNIFMLPVLLRHDRARFEVHVYYTGTLFDEYTRQAQACAGHWCEAAPVQATFLGYPHSTGLSRMDWLVGDATVSPAEHAHLFSEGIAQLPGSVFCWAPVDDYPLPAPRPADAPLVLGSFNNSMKLSPTTMALWSRVLRALPQSQLLLKAPSLRDAAVQARFTDLFAEHGIARERLLLRGPSGLAEMMQEYGDMDIAQPHALQRRHHHPAGAVDGRAGAGADRPQFCRPHGGEFLAHLGPAPLDCPERRCLCGRSRGAGARCCPSAPGPGRVARANGRIAFVRHQQLCACL